MTNELPDYLKEGDGYMDITLRTAISVSGVKVSALRMREPDVNDHLVYEATKGSDGAREASLIANLCEISQDEIKTLKLRDFKRTQEALGHFLG